MKRILTVLAFLLSSHAFASGKLTVKPSYNVDEKHGKFMVGLAVYERIQPDLFYNGWFGGGEYDPENGFTWYKTSQGIEAYFGKLSVGTGLSYQYNPETKFDQTELYTTASLSLW